jgi:hypothetical protein
VRAGLEAIDAGVGAMERLIDILGNALLAHHPGDPGMADCPVCGHLEPALRAATDQLNKAADVIEAGQ